MTAKTTFVTSATLAIMATSAVAEGELNLYSSRHYDTDERLYSDVTDATGITINRIEGKADELIVRMPQDILFAVDSAQLRPDLRADLFPLADSLQRYPDRTVQIGGHTDNTGTASYNQGLSERRAQSVATALTSAGVPSFRLRTFGAGENQPIASNLTPEGRQQNRRVDIVIQPN